VEAPGPGKLTKALGITAELNRSHILKQNVLKIEDDGYRCKIVADKRVGIGYASQEDQDRLWRFKIN
jgi:DNA-3-methyladenine glycosylase